jgi:hypothetical protein
LAGKAMTENEKASPTPTPASAEAPKWIYDEVIPALGSRVRSLHLLKQKGGRRSVLLFSEEAALVAEKTRLGGVKVYRVDYPRGLLLNESKCPHCHKRIQEPVGKIAHISKSKKRGPETDVTSEDVLAYARDMKMLRQRAKSQPGGKGPIKDRAAAKKLRRKHGL